MLNFFFAFAYHLFHWSHLRCRVQKWIVKNISINMEWFAASWMEFSNSFVLVCLIETHFHFNKKNNLRILLSLSLVTHLLSYGMGTLKVFSISYFVNVLSIVWWWWYIWTLPKYTHSPLKPTFNRIYLHAIYRWTVESERERQWHSINHHKCIRCLLTSTLKCP